ncbi:MAG: hypothetical protein HUJ95_02000, partial [Bacteroidales bacterium]|nr:hypothetical protein [Bacteroidales bacterium]
VSNQFFFVNGRYFRSGYLYKAVLKAYENLIPEGYSPSYFIFLKIDPSKIDVNVDPEKTEIKFEDDSIIFNVLYGAIRQAIGMDSIGTDINFEAEIQIPTMDKKFIESDPAAPKISSDPFYNPFEKQSCNTAHSQFDKPYSPSETSFPRYENNQANIFSAARQKFDALFTQQDEVSKCLVVAGKYIVASRGGKLTIVNIARAYEKIYYERYYQALSCNEVTREVLIFPIEIDLSPIDAAALKANIDLLLKAGFEIEVNGTSAVVSATPGGISSSERAIRDILDGIIALLDGEQTDLSAQIIATLAQKYAVSAASYKSSTDNVTFSEDAAQVLINNLMETSNPAYTLGGRKTFHIIELNEIEKLF